MRERGPVESYLSDLHRRLPYPAPRLINETREHLLEATAASLAAGVDEEEAERRAVEGYGPVDDLVAAVLSEGSALMSPLVVRLMMPLALALSLPAALFMFAILIEWLSGTQGSSGVFGSTFESWGNTVNGLIAFGPLIALLLILLTSMRLHRERGVKGFAATIELKMSRPMMWGAVVVAVMATSVIGYGVADGYATWRDWYNANWTCTTDAEGRQVCYQGLLLPEEMPAMHNPPTAED